MDLYKTSGHWAHYKENMFPVMKLEEEEFVLRPMNCPHHMMIYANQPHSYRNLPIRIGEIAHDFRYEPSGTLKGIERGRHFCQNDAHLFVTPDQIKDEVSQVIDLIFDVYKDFGITDYRCVLSLRDPEDKVPYMLILGQKEAACFCACFKWSVKNDKKQWRRQQKCYC